MLRLILLLLLALPAASLAQPAGTLVVLHKSDDTALFLNAVTGAHLATLSTGREPHEIATSPDGRLALAGNYGDRTAPGRSVSVLDLAARRVTGVIDLGDRTRPHGIAWLSPTEALITAESRQTLVHLNVATGEIVREFPTGRRASHMVAVQRGVALVPDIASGTVARFVLETGEALPEWTSGAGAEGIAVTPDGATAWITNRADDTVAVFEANADSAAARIPTCTFPIRALATPDGQSVLVTCGRSGDLAVFDVASRTETARIPLVAPLSEDGARYFADQFGNSTIPIGIAVSPCSRYAYVALTRADVVAVVDLQTREVLSLLPTGRQPDGVVYVQE